MPTQYLEAWRAHGGIQCFALLLGYLHTGDMSAVPPLTMFFPRLTPRPALRQNLLEAEPSFLTFVEISSVAEHFDFEGLATRILKCVEDFSMAPRSFPGNIPPAPRPGEYHLKSFVEAVVCADRHGWMEPETHYGNSHALRKR